MGSGTSPMGKGGGGASQTPKTQFVTVAPSQVFVKGSIESVSNFIPGGKSAIAAAWNESGGNGYRAARMIQEMSGRKTEFLGKKDD